MSEKVIKYLKYNLSITGCYKSFPSREGIKGRVKGGFAQDAEFHLLARHYKENKQAKALRPA